MVVNYIVKKKIGSSNLKGKLEMRRMKLLKTLHIFMPLNSQVNIYDYCCTNREILLF